MPPPPPPSTEPSASAVVAGSTNSHALRKFTLHPTSLSAPTSPITVCLSTTSPITLPTLAAIRTTLVNSRILAAERLNICDSNRKILNERQAMDKRALDEGAKLKEMERKRKREEDEKREKERLEKSERDRLEKEKGELEIKRKEQEVYEKVRLKKEEDKRIADELERAVAVKKAIEEKEKKKVIQVLELVRVNAAERVADTSTKTTTEEKATSSEATEATSPGDVSMVDVSVIDIELSKSEPVVEGTSTPISESIVKSQSSNSLDVKVAINGTASKSSAHLPSFLLRLIQLS